MSEHGSWQGKALKPGLCEVTEAEDQRREKSMQAPLLKDRPASAKNRAEGRATGAEDWAVHEAFPVSLSAFCCRQGGLQ